MTGWMGTAGRNLWSDARYALRSLLRQRVYVVTAVLATATGVGAATAVFSVVDGVLLRPLRYTEPERIVTAWAVTPQGNATGSPSYPDFLDWRAGTTSFSSMAFVRGAALTHLDDALGAARILTAFVTPDFVAAVSPAVHLGNLAPLAAAGPGEEVIAVKYSTWRTRFGADSSVVGRLESFSDGRYRVVAVLAPGVDYPLWAEGYARLTPERVAEQGLATRGYRLDTRVVARLSEGTSLEQAREELSAVAAHLAEQYPDSNEDWSTDLRTLRELLVGSVETSLLVLLAGVAGLLFIASANVAGLSLARTLDRARELGIRASLGAPGGRVAALLVTENVLIAGVGGALGVLLARTGVDAFLTWGVPGLPRTQEITVDARVVLFAAGVSLLSGLLAGLIPALFGARTNPMDVLRGGGPTGTREGLRGALVAGQVAVTVALVATTALLGRSFQALQHVDRGFDLGDLVTLRLNLPAAYEGRPDARRALYERILDETRGRPGVAQATLVNHLPLTGTGVLTPLVAEGVEPDATPPAWLRTAGPDFFQVLGIPVVSGRSFDAADDERWSGSLVVSQALARQLWGDAEPLGRRLTLFRQISADADFGAPVQGTVVGVVGNTRTALRADGPTPAVYVPLSVHPWPSAYLVVRPRPGASTRVDIQAAVGNAEPQIPVTDVVRYEVLSQFSVGRDRFLASLSAVFSTLALFLALIGIHGMLAYSVGRQSRELAIQMAMGCAQARIVGRVIRKAALLVGAGVVAGIAGALILTRFLASILYQVSPLDPTSLAAAALVVTLVGLFGAWSPARKAARADPMTVLRV